MHQLNHRPRKMLDSRTPYAVFFASMVADVGSETFGVLSSPFLDQVFKTVCYELQVDIHADGSSSYDEDTQLQIQGKDRIFHHTNANTLTRVA